METVQQHEWVPIPENSFGAERCVICDCVRTLMDSSRVYVYKKFGHLPDCEEPECIKQNASGESGHKLA